MDRRSEIDANATLTQGAESLVPPAARRLHWVFLALVVYSGVEGLLKRLTGYSLYVYPIKDLFYLVVLLHWAFLGRARATSGNPPYALLLMAYVSLVFVQALNPHLPSIFIWLAGVRTSYQYVLLYFVAYQAFRTEEQVLRLTHFLGVLAVVTALGSMIESTLGLDWIYRHKVQVFISAIYMGASGDWVIRPSSITTGPGAAAMIGYFGAIGLLGLAVASREWLRRTSYVSAAGIALGGVLLSAVRLVWLQAAIAMTVFGLLGGALKFRRAKYLAIPGAVAIALSLLFSRGEIRARFQTVESPLDTYLNESSASQRYAGLMVLPRIIADFPLGAGPGWNAPRQDLLAPYRGQEVIEHSGVHNFLSLLALEVGLPGLVLFLLFSLRTSLWGLRRLIQRDDRQGRSLYTAYYALFMSMVISFLVGGGIQGWPGEYYWLFAAIVMRLGQRKPESIRSGSPAGGAA